MKLLNIGVQSRISLVRVYATNPAAIFRFDEVYIICLKDSLKTVSCFVIILTCVRIGRMKLLNIGVQRRK